MNLENNNVSGDSSNGPFNVRLTKLRSAHNNLRTDVVEGEAFSLPVKGKDFVLFARPLTPNSSFRQVRTTPVELIEKISNEYIFHTANSVYKLEVLNEH